MDALHSLFLLSQAGLLALIIEERGVYLSAIAQCLVPSAQLPVLSAQCPPPSFERFLLSSYKLFSFFFLFFFSFVL